MGQTLIFASLPTAHQTIGKATKVCGPEVAEASGVKSQVRRDERRPSEQYTLTGYHYYYNYKVIALSAHNLHLQIYQDRARDKLNLAKRANGNTIFRYSATNFARATMAPRGAHSSCCIRILFAWLANSLSRFLYGTPRVHSNAQLTIMEREMHRICKIQQTARTDEATKRANVRETFSPL